MVTTAPDRGIRMYAPPADSIRTGARRTRSFRFARGNAWMPRAVSAAVALHAVLRGAEPVAPAVSVPLTISFATASEPTPATPKSVPPEPKPRPRKRGAVRFDRAHLIPFLYELHHRLHLGQWGGRLLGAVAVVWVLDCFVGLYLAWPRPKWTAVKSALGVKWRAGTHRRHYDLHRAGGLWFWAVLLTLAVSGVYFNLNREVFRPVLSVFTPITPTLGETLPRRVDPAAPLAVNWDQAIARAAAVLAQTGATGRLGGIRYAPSNGVYTVGFHTTADIATRYPGTHVYIAGETGRVLAIQQPNEGTAGDVFMQWQFPLHSGQAFGMPGRILIFLTGLAVATLSVTGVAIWWRKRAARLHLGDAAVANRASETTTT